MWKSEFAPGKVAWALSPENEAREACPTATDRMSVLLARYFFSNFNDAELMQ